MLLAASCQPNEVPCFETYIPEVPITAVFDDTMAIADPIEVTIHFRDSLLDVNSGEKINVQATSIDNRFEFVIGRLDTNALDIAVERFFEWEDIVGEVVEQETSSFTRLYLRFEQGVGERVCSFRLYPQRAGVFYLVFTMATDFIQDLELEDLTDCFEKVENIHYNTNERSDQNNYYLYQQSEYPPYRALSIEDLKREGIFAFVVE